MSYGRNPGGGRPKIEHPPPGTVPERSLRVLEWYCKKCRVYRTDDGSRCIECLSPMTATRVQMKGGKIWPKEKQ